MTGTGESDGGTASNPREVDDPVFRCGCLLAFLFGPLAIAVMVHFFFLPDLSLPGPGCGGCLETPMPVSVPSVASPAAVVATPAGVPAGGSSAGGNQFARAQLALLRWPAGTRVAAAPPLVMQRRPLFGWQIGQDMTAADGTVRRIPLPLAQAVAYFRAHPPAGWQLTLDDPSGRMSGSVGGAVNTVLVYGRGPAPPPGIWAAQVLVSLHPGGAGASLVRADTEVGWFDARSPAEDIGGFGAMTVTGPGGTRAFFSPAPIAAVARLLNGLPAVPADEWLGASTAQYDCRVPAPGYTVAFAVKRGGAPWAKVVLDQANPQIQQGCFVDVSVWSGSPWYDYEPQGSLLDVGHGLASYLATLMR